MNKKITILFDLDGTLIDSTKAILLSFKDSIYKYNEIDYNEQLIVSLIGHPLEIMFKNLGVKKESIQKHIDEYKLNYRRRSKPMTKLLPNALKAIHLAKEFAILGIVTTKTAKYSKELLIHLNIDRYFDVLIGREDVINPKPHPEPINKALDTLKIRKKDNVFMIGDTCLDMICAKEAKVNGVGVLCGYGSKEDLMQCVDIITKDSLQAIKSIEKVINLASK